jgi:hypothetical protein
MNMKPTSALGYALISFSGALWLYWLFVQRRLPADVGDGIQHFFYAQAVFSDPVHALNHWAKPLFTLLASPFAQLGFQGMVLFNGVVFFVTALIARMVLVHMRTPIVWQAVFPLLLLISGDYVMTVIAGLTEPLFNLVMMLAVLFLVRKQTVAFALAVSFLPYLRSEGQLPVILAVAVLLVLNRAKHLPFLLVGSVIYAVIGAVVLGDFWWYFTESPYVASNAVYGSGSTWHYVISYRNYLDNVGLFMLIIAVGVFLWKLKQRTFARTELVVLLFGLGTFFGIIGVHSLLYAKGMYGAYGLTRLATQGLPVLFLICLWLIGNIEFTVPKWRNVHARLPLVIVAALGLFVATTQRHDERLKPLPQALIDFPLPEAGKVVYHHPLVPYLAGENPFTPGSRFIFWQRSAQVLPSEMLPGDWLVWDAQFGPAEMNLPLDLLLAHPDLELVAQAPLDGTAVTLFRRQE